MALSASVDRQAQIRPLDRRNNPAMLEILRQSPIETGGLSICFDRQPDIFAMADLKYAPAIWRGFFEGDTLAGFGMVGYHSAYVNGSVTPVMHITDCYIRPGSRGRGYLKSALGYFSDEGAGRAQIGYAVVMKGNRAAEAQIGDRFAETPCGLKSRIIGDLVARSIVLAYPRRASTNLKVRRARLDDIPDVVGLLQAEHQQRLFGLVTDCDVFAAQLAQRSGLSIDDYYVAERAGKLEGVCAAWDTSAFKQNRVVRYGFGLSLVRAASIATARIGGLPTLPRPGEAFRDVFLTDWAVRDRSEEVMHALIEHIYREYRDRRYHTLIFGSCAQDLLLRAARRFPGTDLVSHIALISLDVNGLEYDARLPFIDLALL
jgi:hypothetical protein